MNHETINEEMMKREMMNQMKGGDYAFAEKVYGKMDDQHRVSDNNNVIKSNYVSGGKRRNKKKGGMYETVLVPVALVAANNIIKSRKSTMSNKRYKKSRKSFRKSRFTRRRK